VIYNLVRRVMSPDGLQRMNVESSGALFRFTEDSYFTEDGYSFWTPTHFSGLYSSADDAEKAAHQELPWLRAGEQR